MRRLQIVALLIMVLWTVACSSRSAPVGTYDCYGHEGGMLAHAGRLYIRPDGTIEFLRKTGTWTYDSEASTFTFEGDVPLIQAHYDAALSKLDVDLRSGVDITHAELGTMSCELQ